MSRALLSIRSLQVRAGNTRILDGVTLRLGRGETHVLMGPNGSGKSTLAMTLIGHPIFKVMGGSAVLNGRNVLSMKPEERARRGLFVSFQYPVEVPGVPMRTFLRAAVRATRGEDGRLDELIGRTTKRLGFGSNLIARTVNEGLSGGEKKRAEILQLAVLQPKVAILDEPDSGLDVDSLKDVLRAIRKICRDTILLVITHNPKVALSLKPDCVHVMVGGKIVRSGDRRLAATVADLGFGSFSGERRTV